MATPDNKAAVLDILRDILKHLADKHQLDFEYLGSLGIPELNSKLFDVVFKGTALEGEGQVVAKSQNCGLTQGLHNFVILLAKHHCSDFVLHVPEKLAPRFEYAGERGLNIQLYKEGSTPILAEGDVLVVDPNVVTQTLTPERVAEINSKQVIAMLATDRLCLEGVDKQPLTSLQEVLRVGLLPYTSILATVENFAFFYDLSTMLGFPGLNTGFTNIRFESAEFAADYERQMTMYNRLTISTHVKLGDDFLQVLLTDPHFSQRFASALVN